jgi:hypothetical protein
MDKPKSDYALSDWQISLKRAILNNRQLDFSSNAFLSYLNSHNQEPEIEMLKLRSSGVISTNTNEKYILSDIDSRGKIYDSLKAHPKCDFCIYYPLTKEKFRFSCEAVLVSKLDTSEKKLSGKLVELYQQVWATELGAEERKMYTEIEPGSVKIANEKLEELAVFNTPELAGISENFVTLVLVVYRVEHTCFTMPQVIADSRMPMFESEFKPYKYNKKYLHVYNKVSSSWSLAG